MNRRYPKLAALLVGVVLIAGAAACDDQLKYIPIFSSMANQPSIEAYEQPARAIPEGAVALGSHRSYDLQEATALLNPLAIGSFDLEVGGEVYQIYCSVCHGTEGRGDGPVVGPNRIPAIPTLDLHSEQARSYTDGYIWGMITNGRGLMPSYRRIPADLRWEVVSYVRALQEGRIESPAAE